MQETSLTRLRRANAIYFFISGFGYSSWTSRIPGVKESLKLNDAHFGTLLFMMPVGLILTMPFTGKLLDHFKSRTIMLIGAIVYNGVLACIGFCGYTWMLGIALFFFGSSRNMMNLSMNAQAIGVQALYNRSIMSSFHAVWSMAGFAGAAIGYLMVTLNIIPAWHLLGVSLLLTALTLYYYKDALDQRPDHSVKRSIFTLPPKSMLVFSLICFTSMACENTMYDWSGIYIRQVLHGSKAIATIAFVIYMVAMTSGRLAGDRMADKFGIQRVLAASGILIFSGFAITVLSPYIPLTLIGYLLTGFGVSCVVPFVFSLAGKIPMSNPGAALASISSLGYLGFLLVPPMIGYVAQASSLRISFAIIAVMGLFMIRLSSRIKTGVTV
ncbi:MAG TPA: MFS transporter [Puia sp.]|jgi:MFS family permease|nr:MFS transporter [Puia sp.]